MQYRKITDISLKHKIVLIRTDMNVPIDDHGITDATRITAGLSTIKYAMSQEAKVIIATHLGRPHEGICNKKDSVAIIAQKLAKLLNLNQEIPIITDLEAKIDFKGHNIVMLENVRCNIGEKNNSDELGQKYAALCDVFVHDAFAAAHRAEASTDKIGVCAKEVCAGLLMSQELEALTKVAANPVKPVVAIVAGSKISTKLTILNNLADKVDYLIVGGGILNTFLVAKGFNVAKSIIETDLVNDAKHIIQKMEARGASVPIPDDVIVAEEVSPAAKATAKKITSLSNQDMILDIGYNFAKELATIIAKSGTIIWNGPVGVFEIEQFSKGTETVAKSIAMSHGFSLAGGGDTIAAINKYNLMDKIDYVSTAGGALLEFLEGKPLPGITLLTKRYKG